MKQVLFLSVAAVLAAGPALSQTDDQNRLQDTTLSGEDRDDTRLGEDAYATRFQGLYAVDGRCGEHGAVWAFATDSVTAGDLICTDLGKMTWEDDGLVVPLAQCSDRGEEAEDRTIVLGQGEGDALTVLTGGQDLQLKPCSRPAD